MNQSVIYAQSKALGLPFSYHIDAAEYNAGMLSLDIQQDKRGFMYLANNFGLLEFDGAAWQTYPVKEGSKLRSIAITDDGNIYVAAQGEFGFFSPSQLSKLEYRSLSQELPTEHQNLEEVWKVFKGSNEVYFCAFDKVFVYFQDQLVDVIPIPESFDFFFINNRLYAQTFEAGLQVLFNGEFSTLDGLKLNDDEFITATIKDLENSVLFMTNTGRALSSAGGIKFTIKPEIVNANKLNITSGIRLQNGNIALGTETNGLIIVSEDGKMISQLTKNTGLRSRNVVSLLEDIDGNLWVARNNGITVVELGLPFSYINEEIGLPGSGYDAYADSEVLYLATNYGLYAADLTKASLSFDMVENTSGQGYSITEIDQNLFLGHHQGGFYLQDNIALPIATGTGMWKVIKDPVLGNKIIAGTYTGLDLYESKNNVIRKLVDIPGLTESSRVMEFDEYGNLWMTHGYKGVFGIELTPSLDSIKRLTYYGIEDGLPSNELVNVYKINNKLLFTGIDGVYAFDYQANSFYKDTVTYNVPEFNQPINFLSEDGNGNIYFLALNSMGLLKKGSSGNYEANSNIFNKVFSQLNDDLLNISIINSNNVLFGAKEGFVVYNPLATQSQENGHQAFIRNITNGTNNDFIFTDSLNTENSRELSYDQNSLYFNVSSNFLNDYQETEYTYFLEGFDDSWSAWTKSTSTNYTNLFEGEYIFHVKARNIYNEESKIETYAFVIKPPWYRSTLAYSSYGILLFGSFILSFITIDRRYRKSKKRFETAKQQEVDAIGTKLETLSQTTAEEINRLQAEKLEAEVEKKNTELAASTMNLINKNKFISGIKDNLNSITKKSRSAEVKKELASIMKEIDKNISHDDDWKQFTFHFNNVHGDFTNRLTGEFNNLSSQDIRLCSYLRLNLSTKEIADLLNISVRGVEISRYRLRKKLKLERSQNLAEFILNY
jgi:DNA-binding CsgD family transcriptional regulator